MSLFGDIAADTVDETYNRPLNKAKGNGLELSAQYVFEKIQEQRDALAQRFTRSAYPTEQAPSRQQQQQGGNVASDIFSLDPNANPELRAELANVSQNTSNPEQNRDPASIFHVDNMDELAQTGGLLPGISACGPSGTTAGPIVSGGRGSGYVPAQADTGMFPRNTSAVYAPSQAAGGGGDDYRQDVPSMSSIMSRAPLMPSGDELFQQAVIDNWQRENETYDTSTTSAGRFSGQLPGNQRNPVVQSYIREQNDRASPPERTEVWYWAPSELWKMPYLLESKPSLHGNARAVNATARFTLVSSVGYAIYYRQPWLLAAGLAAAGVASWLLYTGELHPDEVPYRSGISDLGELERKAYAYQAGISVPGYESNPNVDTLTNYDSVNQVNTFRVEEAVGGLYANNPAQPPLQAF